MNIAPSSRIIAFLGNYLPRRCGIATFTHNLCRAVAHAAPDAQCIVAAVNDRLEGYDYPPEVRVEISQKDEEAYRSAADEINQSKAAVLCVQHEYGIYGGPAGKHLLELLDDLRLPVVTTLHTILQQPDPTQRHVMSELANRSERLVVMARKGADLLRDVHGVPESKIDVIPHGIPDVPFADSNPFKQQLGVAGKHVLLTFGLLGPGKGVEYAIRALPAIIERHPNTIYLILGATHPHLIAREGEKYRTSLEQLANQLGVANHVVFFNRFVTEDDLKDFVGAADIYLTPYLNEAQITSGALSYVFGAGKAVVSTPYWHACELLGGDRGILTPFRDPHAISAAVCSLLDDPNRLAGLRHHAYAAGRSMIWPVVARHYLSSFDRAKAERRAPVARRSSQWIHASRPAKLPLLRLGHVLRMTDDTGILQHAVYNVPNLLEGYCTDDNSRAFLLCSLLQNAAVSAPVDNLDLLATRYLAFLAAAFDRDHKRFRNFMSHQRQWLESVGSEDSHGRALWALGSGATRSGNEGHRRLSAHVFQMALPAALTFTSPRAWAFALLGIHDFIRGCPHDPAAADARALLVVKLMESWRSHRSPDWPWFESSLTYDNARLSQALVVSGAATNHTEALDAGLASLRWLAGQQRAPAGHFRPVGCNGFHNRDGARADFDQQPIEACAMVSACLEAFRATHDNFWWHEARRAFEWFLGRNDVGIPLHDPVSGGCRDGLHCDRANENQGAESTLSFQLALAEMTAAENLFDPPTPTRNEAVAALPA